MSELSKQLTRRDFLKLGGALLIGGAAAKIGVKAWESGYDADSPAGKIRRLIVGPLPELSTEEAFLTQVSHFIVI